MATTISEMQTWATYYVVQKPLVDDPEISEHAFKFWPLLNEKVSLWQGNINSAAADAIVNAIYPPLLCGGEMDGAIHCDASKQLNTDCVILNGCQAGDAKIMRGYKLPSKYIIQTVGSVTPPELAKSYKNTLAIMLQHSLRSIVFPCIGTGIGGYDPHNAAHIAICETRMFLEEHHENVERIVFCVGSEEDLRIYEKLLQRYFPLVEAPDMQSTLRETENDIMMNPETRQEYEQLLRPCNPKEISSSFDV